ncbi:anthranilate synthase component II [Shimazuella kribbensis]|uniref:anthranilate synthase component II n=1 Tax=Shimazuella kribbensis TaxID=139808 RepID=UPI00040B087E|nr:aminodeoxychorismate/anthranilate synthase component II [Shimazuella kribbensis]
MIVMIDNYDSFTYNLVQYFGELGEDLRVIRNDEMTIEEIRNLSPKMIVISPGPGTPDDAGITLRVIEKLAGDIPIFGVCLGHQSIGQAFGGKIIRASQLMHGKTSDIHHDGKGIFQNLPTPFTATRYHSLIIDPASIPETLEISAQTESGEIMAVRHRFLPIEGVQFHPESLLSQYGKQILTNFIRTYAS